MDASAAASTGVVQRGSPTSHAVRPQLPDCHCRLAAEDEAHVWLQCVASGLLPPPPPPSSVSALPSFAVPTPPRSTSCPLLAALLTAPLLECVALLDEHSAHLSLTPTAGLDWLQWSVAAHHLLHSIHAQLREEAAATVLSASLALRRLLATHSPSDCVRLSQSRPPQQQPQQPQGEAVTASEQPAQLSSACHTMLSTAVTSLISACLAATSSTVATSTAIAAATRSQHRDSAEARTGLLHRLLLPHIDSESSDEAASIASSLALPSAEQLALFIASLDELAALSHGVHSDSGSTVGRPSEMDDGRSGSSLQRLASFVCSLLPPTCPHSRSAADDSGTAASSLWSSVAWRLVLLHIRPLLRHLTQSQQKAITSAVLRPCWQCCVWYQVPHTQTAVADPRMPLFELVTVGQQLLDSSVWTDSAAFASQLLPACTAHLAAVLESLRPSATRSSHKRKRASLTADTASSTHSIAHYVGPLLELMSVLRCVSRAPLNCWQLDSLVSHISASHRLVTTRTIHFPLPPSSCSWEQLLTLCCLSIVHCPLSAVHCVTIAACNVVVAVAAV